MQAGNGERLVVGSEMAQLWRIVSTARERGRTVVILPEPSEAGSLSGGMVVVRYCGLSETGVSWFVETATKDPHH